MMEETPEWMDNDFFSLCLRNEYNRQNIQVSNFTVSSAAPPGNNYGSLTMRVKVEYKNIKSDSKVHVKSLIVKSEPIHGQISEFSIDQKFIEPIFYYQFIQKSKKYLEKCVVPNHLYSPRPAVTILEDLTEKGFVMADRLQQLDFDHCRLYMIAVAHLHAASVPVFKEFPKLRELLGKEKMFGHKCNLENLFVAFIKGGMECFVEEVKRVERFKRYAEIIKEATPNLWEMLVEAHKPSEVLNTINQGDPWTTNMMFKYNHKGAVSEIKLLDFQFVRFGSPVNDVMYYLWSSANNEVKKHNLKELYHVYIDALNKKLKECNCTETLTYDQMIANVRKLSPLAMFISACIVPLICSLRTVDFLEFRHPDQVPVFKKYYDENFCTKYLPHLLESLEENGIFNFLQEYGQNIYSKNVN